MRNARQAEGDEDNAPLIFAWKDRYHRKLRLTFFLTLGLGLHIFCFYLFQVTYPKTERRLPYTAQLTVLNPRDSLTQVVMRQIDDRTVSIESAARQAIEATQIEDYAPKLRPFFKGYEMGLKSPPPIFPSAVMVDLIPAGSAVLPPGPAVPSVLSSTPPPYVRNPHMTIRGPGLENRDLLKAVDWSDQLQRFESTSGFSAASFMIAVDSGGLIRQCLPTEGEESGILTMLHQKVKSMRFQPRPDSALQWGWVDLKW